MNIAHFRAHWQTYAVAATVGVVAAIALMGAAVRAQLESQREIFLHQADSVREDVARKASASLGVGHSLAILFNTSTGVDADQFRILSEEILAKHAPIDSILYAPLVKNQDRIAFEESIRDEGFITFAVTDRVDKTFEPAAQRQRYCPVLYHEPFTVDKARLLGFDVCAEPNLQDAVQRAIETGEVASSSFTMKAQGQTVLWLFRATYAGKEVPKQLAARRASANGVVALRIDVTRLAGSELVDQHTGLKTSLYSLTNVTKSPLLLRRQYADRHGALLLTTLERGYRVSLADHGLALFLYKPAYFHDGLQPRLVVAAALGGLLLLFLAFSAARISALRTEELKTRNLEIERQVTEKTNQVELLNRQNELLLNSAGEGIYGLDMEGQTTFVNPAAARMIGWEPEELIGKPAHDILHHTKPDGSPYPRQECPIGSVLQDGTVHRVDNEVFWRKDGSSFPVEYISTPIREQSDLVGAVVSFRDITEHKQAEAALKSSEERFRNLIEGSIQGIYIHRDFEPLFVNRAFANILGYDSTDELLASIESIEAHHAPHERVRIRGYKEARLRGEDAPVQYEYDALRKDGTLVTLQNSVRVVNWAGERAIQSTVIDISEARELSEQLSYQASHDALTGLLNRRAFEQRLQQLLATAQ
ncbi:MAG: PAS domain S-box protein, partial [Gammaproteobacteria bacterium]|nr:PAS domain S-box protein [Gammaproteobacteria bacterium]